MWSRAQRDDQILRLEIAVTRKKALNHEKHNIVTVLIASMKSSSCRGEEASLASQHH
jgi:hypothetical protein